jgi:uncharacterized protein YneF (UPF0154 family)
MGKSAKVCSAVGGLYFIGKHQLFEIIEKTFLYSKILKRKVKANPLLNQELLAHSLQGLGG